MIRRYEWNWSARSTRVLHAQHTLIHRVLPEFGFPRLKNASDPRDRGCRNATDASRSRDLERQHNSNGLDPLLRMEEIVTPAKEGWKPLGG